MTVKAIGKTKSPHKILVIGSHEEKYKQLEASTQMMAELLDLHEPNNEVNDMREFVPFDMNVTTEGLRITMMEIPLPPIQQPSTSNSTTTQNATRSTTKTKTSHNPSDEQDQNNNDEHSTDGYEDN